MKNQMWILPLAFILGFLTYQSPNAAASPKPIPQTYLGIVSYNRYVEKKPWEPIHVGEVTIKIADAENTIAVDGVDKRGRPWIVYVPTAIGVGFSTAWTADLGGGQKGFIFVHSYPRNGHCAEYSPELTTILFNSDGVPLPASFHGEYRQDFSFEPEGGKGLLDLAYWSGNGKAQLVQYRCYFYDFSEPRQDNLIYGLSDVYEARDGAWVRLSMKDRSPHESAYSAALSSDDPTLIPYAELKDIFKSDYSSDHAAQPRHRLLSYKPDLELDDGQRCSTAPDVVLSTTEKTIAVLGGTSDLQDDLLNQIIRERLLVQFSGQLEEGTCSPAMIWATKP